MKDYASKLSAFLTENGSALHKLDPKNPAHRDLIEAMYSGAENLKKMSPQLSQMINSPAGNDTDRFMTTNGSALQDNVFIRHAVYEKTDRTIYSAGKVSLTGPASQLHVVASILSKDGEILGQKGFFRRDCGYLEVACDAIDLSEYPSGAKFVIHASYLPVQTNQLCSMIISGQAAISEEDVFESISVTAPVKRKEHNGPEINVSYARTPLNRELIDYIYPERRDENRNQYFFLEMIGQACLKGNYQIDKVLFKESGGHVMCMTFAEHGDIFYENDFMKCISINSDRNIISWDFYKEKEPKDPKKSPVPTIDEDPANWNASIPMSILKGNRVCDFDMRIAFTIKGRPSELFEAVVTSNPDTARKGSKGCFVIPNLHLYWGCLAEGTRVLMADGSERRIQDIKIGEAVRTCEGRSAEVENIFCGPEPELLCLKSDDGDEICCTFTHPFKTDAGIKRAMDLCETDILHMTDGRRSGLEYCFPMKFDGRVYNLVLNQEGLHYANGYAVGDFTQENRLYNQKSPANHLPMDDNALEAYFEAIK